MKPASLAMGSTPRLPHVVRRHSDSEQLPRPRAPNIANTASSDALAEPPYPGRYTARMFQRQLSKTDDYVSSGLGRAKQQLASEIVRLQRESDGLNPRDPALLELHRESFKRLISSFKAYGPILSQIKGFFDAAINSRMQHVFEMQPKIVNLQAMKNGYDLNLQAVYDKHAEDIRPYVDDLNQLRKINSDLETKIARKQLEINGEATHLSKVKKQLNDLELWQMTLVESMKRWEGKVEQLNEAADQNDHSVWKTKIAIEKTREAQTHSEQKLELKRQEVNERDKEIKLTIATILDLHCKVQNQTVANRVSEEELSLMVRKLKESKNSLKKETALCVDKSRPVTPRPDWGEAAAFLAEKRLNVDGVLVELDIEHKSSQEIVDSLAAWLTKAKEELLEVTRDVQTRKLEQSLEGNDHTASRLAERQEVETAHATLKQFVCLGKGPDVPVYLHAAGKVENKNFSRQQIVAFIHEFWQARDGNEKSRAIELQKWTDNFFRRKFPGKNRVPNVYNIIFGAKRFSRDPECQLFDSILSGNMPEGAYYGRKKMFKDLQAALHTTDLQMHGGRVWRTVDRDEFIHCLTEFFSLKTTDDIRSLRRALSRDQPLPDIRYNQLFEEDENGLPSCFLEALCDQYAADVLQAYPKLEEAIRRAALDDAESKQRVRHVDPSDCTKGSELYRLLMQVPLICNSHLCQDGDEASERLLALMPAMELVDYHDGDLIVQEGGVAQHCFIVKEGGAFVTKEGISDLRTHYVQGDFFGELALTHSDVRAASVVAKCSRRGVCQCIRISKEIFDQFSINEKDNQELLHKREMSYFMASKLAASPRKDSTKAGAIKTGMVTTTANIRAGMSKYFDTAMPKPEIEKVIRAGLGRDDADETPIDDDQMVEVVAFMTNLRKIVVKRFSQYEELTDSQKRADFLRNVSDVEREAIKLCFEEFDEDGDGCIDMTELGSLMKQIYGFEPTSKALAQLMIEIDTDANGYIDLDEFISAMATIKEVKVAGEIFKWRQSFDKHDTDKSGELSSDELRLLVKDLWADRFEGDALYTQEETAKERAKHLDMIQFMIEEADSDGNGEVSWEEFCHMMQKMMDVDSRDIEEKRQKMLADAKGGAERGVNVAVLSAAHGGGVVTREVIGNKVIRHSKERSEIMTKKHDAAEYEEEVVVPDEQQLQTSISKV